MGGGGEAMAEEGAPPVAEATDGSLAPELVQKSLDLGIDPENPAVWKMYRWVAEEFAAATLPEPWSEYSDEQGQIFYYDHNSGESQWSHPLLGTFRTLFMKCQEEPGLHEYYKDLYHNLRQYCDDKKGWWALNLLSTPNGGPPPTPEEVHDMAVYLQIDITTEPDLMWIAKQAVQVALPPNWEELEDSSGNVYFYDKTTGKSTVKHPMDDYFFALVHEERKKLPSKREGMEEAALARSRWMPFLDDLGMTYFVNFPRGVHTYFPPWENVYHDAARVIQKKFSTHLAENRKHAAAALTIQRVYRGHVVRDAVAAWKMECAVLCIQTMWRMYKARDNLLRERAAVLMQSAFRMHTQREQFRREVGALRVQKHYRRHAAQKELGDLRDQRDAAVRIQRLERGRQARKEVQGRRETAAAVTIQKNYRMHQGKGQVTAAKAHIEQEEAALSVQRVYRGHLGRKEVRGLREGEAAVVIQKNARMWAAQRLLGQERASVTIQRFYRGHVARDRMQFFRENKAKDLENKATLIQARYRGHATRKQRKEENMAALFLVIRMQFMFRRFVRQRRERIERMMMEWENALVARVQAKWRGMVQRKKFLRWMAQHKREEAAAGGIQRVWRGAQGRRATATRKAEVDRQSAAALTIQTRIRAKAARDELGERKRVAVVRADLLDGLVPMYEAVHVLPGEPVEEEARTDMIHSYILKDVPALEEAGSDQVTDAYLEVLRAKQGSMEQDCFRRKKARDSSLSHLSLLWRLLKVPKKRWLSLPPEGESAWLSDQVLSKCDGEMARLATMKQQGAKPLCTEASKLMGSLFDELSVRDDHADRINAACNPLVGAGGAGSEPTAQFSEKSLDGMIEEIIRLEGLRPYVQEVLALSIRASELAQLRATLPAPNSRSIMMEKSIAAKKKRAEEEKTRAMVNKEYPETISKLRIGVNALQKSEELPVPFEELGKIFPLPTPQQIHQMIDSEIRYRQDNNSAQRTGGPRAPVFSVPQRRADAAPPQPAPADVKPPTPSKPSRAATPVVTAPPAAAAAAEPEPEAADAEKAPARRPKRRARK